MIVRDSEWRRKQREAHLGIIPWNKGMTGIFDGEKNPFYGKHHTSETKLLISGKKLGFKDKPETRIKKKIATTEHWADPEYRSNMEKAREESGWAKKISKARMGKPSWNKGIPMKKSSKKKLSKSRLGRFTGKDNPFFGKKHRKETIALLKELRKYIKVPAKDNKLERFLQKSLKKSKIKFTTHKPIIGQPDIFIEPNICIFADGIYFHGDPRKYKANDIVSYVFKAKEIWKYDKTITKELQKNGYIVLRFWEDMIWKDIDRVVLKIKQTIGGV